MLARFVLFLTLLPEVRCDNPHLAWIKDTLAKEPEFWLGQKPFRKGIFNSVLANAY